MVSEVIMAVYNCIRHIAIWIIIAHHCSLLDVNECEEVLDNCDENADCENTQGSFECKCKQGYAGDGVNCYGKNDKHTSTLYGFRNRSFVTFWWFKKHI